MVHRADERPAQQVHLVGHHPRVEGVALLLDLTVVLLRVPPGPGGVSHRPPLLPGLWMLVLLCHRSLAALRPPSEYSLVSLSGSNGTMTLSLQSLSLMAWKSLSCSSVQVNFLPCLVSPRMASVRSG